MNNPRKGDSSNREVMIMDMFETVKEILARQLQVDADDITQDTDIVDDLGADSLDVVEMLMAIEQEYGIIVPDDVITSFKTVGDVAKYIETHQQ